MNDDELQRLRTENYTQKARITYLVQILKSIQATAHTYRDDLTIGERCTIYGNIAVNAIKKLEEWDA